MPSAGERGRVWILEDSALEAEMARRALSGMQDVEMFTDGSVLLERAASDTAPDVIVLDWLLPGISGVEVCRFLRASYDPMALPILMLTAQGHKDAVVEALAAGANDYVTKPYDMAELIARVSTLVRTSRLQRAQRSRASQLALSADIGAALTTEKTLEQIASRCAEALATHMEAGAVEVWTTRDGALALLASRAGAAPLPEDIIREVGVSQNVVISDDSATSEQLVGRCGSAAAFVALPLVVREETLGVLAFCTSQRIVDALAVLETVADLLALGMARARAEDDRAVLLERERSSRAEAEAANRSKDEFLAMVSHELRTPLNAITGWTGMLISGGLEPDRVKRALETIERNARSQTQLIDDLLDIGRITSGKLRVEVSTVDIPLMAERAVESVRLAAESKGVTLCATVDAHAGTLTGDADRIQQIVWNLLSNAIKFTPKDGRVTLDVSRNEEGISISVVDTGQGIAPEFLPHVFERFKQADGTMTRTKGGLGLGLAIVKHLAEVHGGTIEARSEGLGHGSTFTVKLPVAGAAERANDAARTSGMFGVARATFDRPRDVEGLRVLILDDEADARDLLRTLLESCKIEVTAVSNTVDAFDAVKRRNIDVVVSDIAMPVEDGFSFIGRVRALSREEGGRVPAIALTAYARLEDRTKALRAGFNSHVAKPVEPSELLAVLSSLATNR